MKDKETVVVKTTLIIDKELWYKFRMLALQKGISARKLLSQLISKAVNQLQLK